MTSAGALFQRRNYIHKIPTKYHGIPVTVVIFWTNIEANNMKKETLSDLIITYNLIGNITICRALHNDRQILSEKVIYSGDIKDMPAELLKLIPFEYELKEKMFIV
jgi:hypothetical protein